MINRAPLEGQYYLVDLRRVHGFIHGFCLRGENTESWIRAIAKHQDGRRDMTTLRCHYAGQGNLTRCIADTKKIQTTLHYKLERALPFNKFLDTLQRMFTIFEEENKPLTEHAKVDKLLTKVQNSGLAAAVAQLRYQLNTTGITFTVAANHLNSEISQTLCYQLLRKINAMNIQTTTTGVSGHGYGRVAVVKAAVVAVVVVDVAAAVEEARVRRRRTIPRKSGTNCCMRSVISSEKNDRKGEQGGTKM